MWVRKRIEISFADILWGMGRCLAGSRAQRLTQRVAHYWNSPDIFVCLSVRSGFDLLLHSMQWPGGSEVLMSGLTIPDMPRIVSQHRLVPVGIDVDARTLQLDPDQLRKRITPRTKAIVVAHLFGGLCDLDPIVEVARQHDLLIIEDCAQAYIGSDYQGDPRADVSMFSFGPIKTNTALQGGVFRIRRREILEELSRQHSQWPRQSRWSFFRRLGKYTFVKLMSVRWVAGSIATALRWMGKNHDSLATRLGRGFAGEGFFEKIRRQPALPLLALLQKKFRQFNRESILRRTRRGQRLRKQLEPHVGVLGAAMRRQTYWVFPILTHQRHQLVQHLWKHGFDATASCSLAPIPGPEGGPDAELTTSQFLLDHVVYLPFDLDMPDTEIDRMASIIRDFAPTRPRLPVRAPAAPPVPRQPARPPAEAATS